MATAITITDKVSPILARFQNVLKTGAIENVMGRAVVNKLQAHFLQLNASRANELGGDRTNFYAGAAKSTNSQARPGEVKISVNQVGIRQRYEGGEIRPLAGKYLTIPASAEAYGHRAREFSDLRFGFAENKFGNLQPALVRASSSQVKFGRQKNDGTRAVKQTGSRGGEVMYFLCPRVFQRADPTVIPPEAELADAAVSVANKFITRLLGAQN